MIVSAAVVIESEVSSIVGEAEWYAAAVRYSAAQYDITITCKCILE